jgi:hypothetical protein
MFFIKMNSTTTTTSIKPIMIERSVNNNDESNNNKNDFNNFLHLFKIFSETGIFRFLLNFLH